MIAGVGTANIVRRYSRCLDELEGEGFELFVVNVQPRQFLPGFRKGPKRVSAVWSLLADSPHQRDARQLPLQVLGVLRAVFGMVQHGIDVIEDVPLRGLLVAVVLAEMLQRPVGDVLVSSLAIRLIGIERETLAATAGTYYMQIG